MQYRAISSVAQKEPIYYFLHYALLSKLIIIVNAELYFILGLLWFY